MLSTLRNQSKSIVVKVLLVLLVLSFGAWGIGDYVTGRSATGGVATVGDYEISGPEFAAEYRREFLRLRQIFGNNLTPEGARSFGVPLNVVQRMVREEALYQRAVEAGFAASDALVLETIQGMEQFSGLTGNFDEQVFAEIVGRAGFTQAAFVERVRKDIVREAYISGVLANPVVPDQLAERLYRYNEESRKVLVVQVPESAVPAADVPDADAVAAYFEDNKENFRAPAYRSVTLVEIGPDTVADDITVTDEEIVASYEIRAAEFSTPATRDVSQIVFDTEAEAANAVERLSAGESFDDVAKELAGLSPADTALGSVTRDGLPFPELVDPVFDASKGDIVGPVQSVLGWHVFRINEAADATVQPLDAVRDQIADGLRQERSLDHVFDLANRIDEMLGQGATLEEISETLNLPIEKIDAVDSRGSNPDGGAVDGPADPAFAANVFEEEIGLASTLIETQNGYYAFRVDDETPARLKTLEEVRADVISNLMTARRIENGRKVADDLRDAAISPAALETAAEALEAQVETWSDVKRDGEGLEDPNTYREALDPIFSANAGEAVVVRAGSGFAVAYVAAVSPPNPAENPDAVGAIKDQLRADMQADLSDLMIRRLAERYDASIDAAAIEREAL